MKIHYDEQWLPPGVDPAVALYPFLGEPPLDPGDPMASRYRRWVERGRDVLERVSLGDAETALFPGKWEHVAGHPDREELGRRAAGEADAAGVPLSIFYWSDSTSAVDVPGATVFRTSMTRTGRRPGEHTMPAWSEDFVEQYLGGELRERPYRPRATVGFCGFARPKTVRSRLARLVRHPGPHAIRLRALQLLESSPHVDTNIVLRSSFYGGVADAAASEQARVRAAYVENMVGSDYVLCARGYGNYSYRLYETLSTGRIPVFVDTDCVLPYEDAVPWRSLCVWVDASELPSIGERVAEFHEALGATGFRDLQHECRRTWLERLSPVGWFSHLHEHFA